MRIQNCTLRISSDEDEPLSTVQNHSTNANRNIAENKNECDLLDADIKNQMNASMQEIVNDDGELNYDFT